MTKSIDSNDASKKMPIYNQVIGPNKDKFNDHESFEALKKFVDSCEKKMKTVNKLTEGEKGLFYNDYISAMYNLSLYYSYGKELDLNRAWQLVCESYRLLNKNEKYFDPINYSRQWQLCNQRMGNIRFEKFRRYNLIEELDEAEKYFLRNLDYNYPPSLIALATMYNAESLPKYDKNLAFQMYLKLANLTNYKQDYGFIVNVAQFMVGNFYKEENDLKNAIKYYKLCGEATKYFNLNEDEDPLKIAEELNKKISKFTDKHDYVVSLFSDKAKKYLEDEHYMFIETSLLVYDFLSQQDNEFLDYSSAIMPILKCVESLLYPIFAKDYFNFLKNKKSINFLDVPKQFKKQNKDEFLENVFGLEYGNILHMCVYESLMQTERYKARPYFVEFLQSRNIDNAEEKIIKFANHLKDVKDKYRNESAHKNRIIKIQAENCLNYLLKTIKFINEFLEDLYPNEK